MKRTLWAIGVVAAGLGEARADGDYTLTLESGSEFDSNIHRFADSEDSTRPVKAELLLRLGARYRGAISTAAGHGGSLALTSLVKAFSSSEGQAENALVLQGDGNWSWRLPMEETRLGVRLNFFDVENFAFNEPVILLPRTFSTAGAEAFLERALGEHRLRLSAGARTFAYDPDPNFDWAGEEVGLSYRSRLWFGNPDQELEAASLDVQARYRLQRRDNAGRVVDNTCGPNDPLRATCLMTGEEGRVDGNHLVGLDVLLTTRRIYSLRYDFEFNRSNSFGNSFARHRIEGRFTSELARSGYFLSLTGTVLINHFLDPLLLAEDLAMQSFVSIEDENRNGVAVGITKDLSRRFTFETRYAFYTNEFIGQATPFQRHTLYAGLMVRLDDP